jgi:osmotically-inducible protein OsmY
MEKALEPNGTALIADLRQQLGRDPRLSEGHWLRSLRIAQQTDGMLLLEGEAERVAQKKIVLEIAAAHPGVSAIVDRLHVRPAEHLRDAQVRSRLREVFMTDPALQGIAVRETRGDRYEMVVAISQPFGEIDYEVEDGVVTLNGHVSDLAIKRVIGVLVWWVPGTRDVINGIVADAEENDGPDRIADAVRAVLEMDASLDAAQIKVGVRHRVVHLTGFLRSAAQRRIAEDDVWYVFGVDEVINDIKVSEA